MKIARKIGYILLSVVALLAIYVVFLWLRPDESLNPAAEAFYRMPRTAVPDEQNAALALTGIDAPAGVDVLEHGKRIRKIRAETRGSMRALQERTLGTHDFVYPREVECWLSYNGPTRIDGKDCASPERLVTIIRESPHLARYKQIQALNLFDQDESYRGHTLISLNKLLGAEILLDVEQGRSELAYQKWRTNHLFLTRLNASGGTWVLKGLGLVAEGISFGILDDLLRRTPLLIASHESELKALLAPVGIERFNLDGIMRAEANVIRSVPALPWLDPAFKRPNYLINRQYEYAQAFLQAARSNPTELERNVNSLKHKYGELSLASADFANLFNGVLARLYVQGQLKTSELLLSMHRMDASQRLNTLRSQIVMPKKSDAEIDAFLQAAPPELRNPFDGKPMRWDPAKRTIIAASPGESWEHRISL